MNRPLLVIQIATTLWFLSRQATVTAAEIQSILVGEPAAVADNSGDTWVSAWAKSGAVYSPSDDTDGFRRMGSGNLALNRIDGDDPLKLSGVTINPMGDYGAGGEEAADGCTWKSSGCYAVDGVLYWVVARHKYGEKSGDPTKRQTAANASIIKSTNYGRTWVRSAKENYEAPMFPGRRFATPYFVEYGQDGKATVDAGDRFLYAVSNNGFWDNGDNLMLTIELKENCQVRARIPDFVEPGAMSVESEGAKVPTTVFGNYLELGQRRRGEKLRITYPLPLATEEVEIGNPGFHHYRYRVSWKGDTVVKMEPLNNDQATGYSDFDKKQVRVFYGKDGPGPLYQREAQIKGAEPDLAPLHLDDGSLDFWSGLNRAQPSPSSAGKASSSTAQHSP